MYRIRTLGPRDSVSPELASRGTRGCGAQFPPTPTRTERAWWSTVCRIFTSVRHRQSNLPHPAKDFARPHVAPHSARPVQLPQLCPWCEFARPDRPLDL